MSNSYLINSNLGIDWCPRKGNWSVINFANFFSTCFLLRWKYVFFCAIWLRRIKTILEKNTAYPWRKIETFSRNKMDCICFCHYFSHAYSLAIKCWASGRGRKLWPTIYRIYFRRNTWSKLICLHITWRIQWFVMQKLFTNSDLMLYRSIANCYNTIPA